MITLAVVLNHLEKIGIIVKTDNQMTLGNITKEVYGAIEAETGSQLVVKLGFTKMEKLEIYKNIEGYAEIKNMGVGDILLPKVIMPLDIHDVAVLVMSHCGSDFFHATKEAAQPVQLYEYLVQHVDTIYSLTLKTPTDPDLPGRHLVSLLQKVYGVRLRRIVSSSVVQKLECINSVPHTPQICFSTFDFTPEDVYVTPEGVKYSDPKPGQIGVPILDLACFAGVARDAHCLPGAVEGFNILRSYSCDRLRSCLGLSQAEADWFFELGRALQLGLSGFFRLTTEPVRAQELIREGEKIINSI